MDYSVAWAQIYEFLRPCKNVILTCHERFDDDALCSIAVTELFLRARGIEFQFVHFDADIPFQIKLPNRTIDLLLTQYPDLSKFDALVVLDTGEMKRLGKGQGVFHSAVEQGLPILNFDHHARNKLYGTLNCIDTDAAATCEMLVCLLTKAEIKLSADMAHILLKGILSDTLNLKVSNVSSRTLRIAADLMDLGADRIGIIEEMPIVANVHSIRTWGHILSEITVCGTGQNIVYAVIDESDIRTQDTSSGLADEEDIDISRITDFMRDIGGVEVAVLFTKWISGDVKVSFRSKSRVNVGKIADALDGGGHAGAASCIMLGLTVKEAIDRVIPLLQAAIDNFS